MANGMTATLDQAPPLPPNLAPQPAAPQAGMSNMASRGGAIPGEATSRNVIETAMRVERELERLATIMPSFAPERDRLVEMLRSGVLRGIQSFSQGEPPAGGGLMSMMGAIGSPVGLP